MLKPKNDEKKKKILEKPKQKRQPRSRYTAFLTTLIIVIFIVIVLIIRSPIREMLVITPTVAARLATITPDPTISGMFDATALDPHAEGSPALSLVVVTNSPTPFNIGITLSSGTDLRAGPSNDFAVVEHLNGGDNLALIGANNDYSWYVVGFRQQPVWIDANVLGQSVESLRQLPVVAVNVRPAVQDTGVTLPPTVQETSIFGADLGGTATVRPVLAIVGTDVSIFAAPNPRAGAGGTIPQNMQIQLMALSEDHQWFLIDYILNPSKGPRLRAWVQASAVGTSINGDVSTLPLIRLQDGPQYVTLIPFPTATPSPSVPVQSPFTLTALAAITATPVLALAGTDIPVYAGPGFNFGTNTTIRRLRQFQLVGVSEDHQWYLVSYVVNSLSGPREQAWVQASVVTKIIGGDVNILPVIRLQDGPGFVTSIPLPTSTPTRVPTRTPTKIPSPTKTPLPKGT